MHSLVFTLQSRYVKYLPRYYCGLFCLWIWDVWLLSLHVVIVQQTSTDFPEMNDWRRQLLAQAVNSVTYTCMNWTGRTTHSKWSCNLFMPCLETLFVLNFLANMNGFNCGFSIDVQVARILFDYLWLWEV